MTVRELGRKTGIGRSQKFDVARCADATAPLGSSTSAPIHTRSAVWFRIGQRSPTRSSEVRRTPRSTPQEPQQRGYHSRNHDARDDREVEIESIVNDMNVAWQPAERDAREPMPSEADKNAKDANND